MADEGMVELRDALGKILASEHADVLREGVGSRSGMSARRSDRRIATGIGRGRFDPR